MNKQYNVVIAGAYGYVGRELMDLVLQHPHLQLAAIHGRSNSNEGPLLVRDNLPVYSLQDIIQQASQIDVLLLATPATTSMEIVAALVDTPIIIVDLSGAFRLPENVFTEWYGIPHQAPHLIKEACYGLVPWVSPQPNHRLIANPGCYATCALMSLLPLFNATIIQTDSIIIDAKSGVSGGGKQTNPDWMFCEMAHNFFPYKIGKHQHVPEIHQTLQAISGQSSHIRFTTSLLPLVRGIAMTIYLQAKAHFSSDESIAHALEEALQVAYANYPFVHFARVGANSPMRDHVVLSLKNVVQTPNMHLGYFVKEGYITLFSCLDNLGKGAASQAIENINAIFQLPMQTGLQPVKEA